MTILLRDPAGKTHEIPESAQDLVIQFDSPRSVSGQWLVFSQARSNRILGVLLNGALTERMGDTHVFSSRLDEVGVEFLVIFRLTGLVVVKLVLDTEKLGVSSYFHFLERYQDLYGGTQLGAASVSGVSLDEGQGRPPEPAERASKLIHTSFRCFSLVQSVKSEVQKHTRGQSGAGGIDAIATLDAWKSNDSWYRASTADKKGSIRVSNDAWVEPLRTIPRKSLGGNRVLGALILKMDRLISMLPRSDSAQLFSGLLQNARTKLKSFDLVEFPDRSEAQRLLDPRELPPATAEFTEVLVEIEQMATTDWGINFYEEGELPFFLKGPELIFQEVAVAAVLVCLGVGLSDVSSAIRVAKSDSGLDIARRYTVWIDTENHGLEGWRDDTILPSGYKPDLVVKRNHDSKSLLVDAKLRAGIGEARFLPKSGVKDIQAYMQEYGLSKSILLVPGDNLDTWQFQEISTSGGRIRSIAVPARALLSDVGSIAGLIEGMWN